MKVSMLSAGACGARGGGLTEGSKFILLMAFAETATSSSDSSVTDRCGCSVAEEPFLFSFTTMGLPFLPAFSAALFETSWEKSNDN